MGLIARARQHWQRRQLRDPAWAFLFDAAPPDEWVALDCETTGLNTRSDEIVSIGAVRIQGRRILSSQRLELLIRPEGEPTADSIRVHRLRAQDVRAGLPAPEAVAQLLRFVGPRPLVGYYLEFDVAMLNRVVRPLIGIGLPQPKIEVSAMYHDWQSRQLTPYQRETHAEIDLRFATIMHTLGLPTREAHDALNDAMMAALAFLKLRALET